MLTKRNVELNIDILHVLLWVNLSHSIRRIQVHLQFLWSSRHTIVHRLDLHSSPPHKHCHKLTMKQSKSIKYAIGFRFIVKLFITSFAQQVEDIELVEWHRQCWIRIQMEWSDKLCGRQDNQKHEHYDTINLIKWFLLWALHFTIQISFELVICWLIHSMWSTQLSDSKAITVRFGLSTCHFK